LLATAGEGKEEDVMLCRDVMVKKVETCRESDSVAACATLMADRVIGFVPVLDAEDRVTGVITDRDIALRVVSRRLDLDTPVRDVMTRDVRVCRPDDDLVSAEDHMAEARKSRLVVVDAEGRCQGVISRSDIAQSDHGARAGRVLREVTRREAPARARRAHV
jgi:CBS domain-containing protein